MDSVSDELQSAQLRELREIRSRLGWLIVLLLTPAFVIALAFVIGLFVALL